MTFRILFCVGIVTCVSCSQDSTLELSTAGSSNESIVLNINLRSSQPIKPTALQWSFYYSPDAIDRVSVVAEGKLSAARKHLICSSADSRTTCIVWGKNLNPLPNGVMAQPTFPLRKSAMTPDIVIALRDVVASSPEGSNFPLNYPQSFTVSNPLRTAQLSGSISSWVASHYSAIRHRVKAYYPNK